MIGWAITYLAHPAKPALIYTKYYVNYRTAVNYITIFTWDDFHIIIKILINDASTCT